MNKGSFLALRLASCAIVLYVSFLHTFSFAQSTGSSDWTDISLSGTDAFSIDAEYRYKVSSQSNFWLYPKEVSARSLVSNESYFGQIFYVSADAKTSYQYNGNFLGTVVQIQKRVLPPWTDVSLTGTDPFDFTYEYRFKMTVPGRPGVPAGDFWYYAKQVGTQSLVMNNGYGEITFVSAANKTAYLSQGTPTGITISQMQRRALTWDDVPLNTTEAYDISCDYRFKMNYLASPQWRPAVPAGDFWHYPERTSAQSHIANANGGYQTFSVFANNKAVFDFNGVYNNAVLQMQKRCNVPPSLAPTCGNPRAKVTFGTYDPAITGNSGANAWTSLTLGNKVIIPENQFFDIKDGTYAIDDGAIVTSGLQNFAVSRHDGYIEFLAIGRRLPAYYGYYEGTITFENVQVDRVEGGLTTATWADIGLETATEGDVATKQNDYQVKFKLAFANQGDGFRVYFKNPTPTPCNCPTGETKIPDPKSPVCIVRASVKGVQDTDIALTGYGHLAGNCVFAGVTPTPPQVASGQIMVSANQQRTAWTQSSPNLSQMDGSFTCPTGTTKSACMFNYGTGPLGEITCGCYQNESTATPKNLSCRTFSDPLIHGRPVFSRNATPAQFCREQGYTHSATVITEYDYLNNGSLWNGSVWEINNHLAAIHEVSCCKLEDKPTDICAPAACAGTPTLKSGSSLTNVLNPQGEAFSSNAQCAGKQISLAPCSSTVGVISTGTSPDGNPLYLWPKTASGLSQDYNLVEIKNQCWFADNLQENPSLWPSPVGTWDNTAPHNGYGRYDFGTTLAESRAEGYLYQFDSGTNNSAAGGAPAEKLQGVCPTGWHVATDCEFQFVEHVYGMSVAEQQTVGVRSSGTVANDIKTGGASGFDMSFSGTRVWNNSGFINGGSEGHLWSSECPTIGCYKRVISNSSGVVTRLQGDGGNYYSSHHAAGSIRCVKDGIATVVNTCTTACQAGQYWCNAENTCKPAGQPCTIACSNSSLVSWTQFSNPSPSNINSPSAASLGSAAGTIQVGGKTIQMNYSGDVRSVGIASNWSWIWTGNTAPFLSSLVSNIPDPAHLLGVFGGSQAMNTLTFSEPVTDPILLFYSIGGGGFNVTYEFDRPFTIVSGSTGMTGMGDFVNPSGNILRGAEGYGVIQFHGTFSTLSFKVPTAEYWSAFTVGLKAPSTCPGSVTCNNNNTCETGESCNCGDCTNGGADDKDRCDVSNGSQMVCTKDIQNTTTPGIFNAVTAQANFDIVNGKLATYLSAPGNLNVAAGEFGAAATELKITQDTRLDAATSFTKEEAWTRAKELLAIPANAQVLWSQTSTKYFNNALGVNERYLYSYVIQQSSGVQKQIFFATEFLPGYGWRKVYTVSKDYPLSTTPTGAEVCQNFTNPRLFLKPVASYQSPAQFCLEQGFRGTSTIINDTYMTGTMTMWNAAGTAWVPNDNGDRIDEIRCCGVPSNATAGAIQVGACCPVGTEWSSTANACVTDKCGEGQYYCHEELKCKPANEPCSAVVCEDKVVFNYTGAVQNYTVPTDVSKIQIKAWGAAGGSGGWTISYIGAAGGYAQGDIGVSGGEQFKIVVGEGGKRASTLRTFGGGGHGTASWGGSGGGLSGIFRNSFTHTSSLLIAGGGSGSAGGGSGSTGDNNAIGFGGGLSGNNGFIDSFGNGAAGGATQSAGGTSASLRHSSLSGTVGGPLSGGDASMTTCYSGGGGGGGGGYYGGGGGLGDWCTFPTAGDTDGGGGSGYLHTSLANASFATATATTAKVAPNKTDPDYVTGVAEGKNTGEGSGGNGLVVITECRPKPVATCNGNGLCDTNESCNCADCNNKVDHCAINGTGEQLICTKDTTPPCFTDKFPYCFPACLDGYTRNASGQCVASVVPDITYTYRTATGGNTAIATCQIGEMLVGGGCTNTGTGGAYFQAGFPIAKNESWQTYTPTYDSAYWHSLEYPATAGGPIVASADGYACATGFSVTDVQATAICSSIPAGEATTIRKGSVAQKSLAQCSAGEVRIAGGCRYTQGGAYYQAGFPLNKGESYSGLNATEDGFVCDTGRATTLVEARVICRSARAGETVTVRSSPSSGATTYSTAQCSAGEIVLGGGCKNITGGLYYYAGYPIKSGTPDVANNIFTIDAFTCGSGATGTYPKAYAICASTVTATAGNSCQNFTGNVESHGGYLHIGQASINQFCVEKGYSSATLVSQYTQSGSCRLWNGTSWYEDTACEAVSNVQCCNTPVVSSAVSSGPQVGACCPPGSAWNSVENRCVPSTCGVGQFYCAAQKKCLPGGTTCDTTVCNNNGLCEGEESCQCGDCVDGPTQTDPTKKADDKDKCSIIGGIQAMCSDDIPTDNKPGACCLPPQTWNTATGTCQECTNTQAPSELKAGVDQPYISCTGNGDTTQTHFKYRLTKTSGTPTADVFISATPVSVGTQVLHTATPFTEGTYKVECFYGTATNVPTDTLSTPHTCTKNIQVKTGNVQGCDAIITHKDSLLTSVLHDANPFSASARCVSRTLDTTLTQPFRLFYGNAAPISLEYDSVFAMLEIVGLSVPNFHSYTAGNTDVRCAVKVGGGYSTNNSCLKTACVGGTCSLPQTFSVVNSANHTCTTEDKSIYDIGCNPLADQTTKDTCAKWFSDAFAAHAISTNTFTTHFTFGGADTPIVCTKYPPGGLPGGLNMYANFVCKALLPNGEEVEIYGAEDNGTPIKALQTTAYTTKKDNQVPTLREIDYYSSESLSPSSRISAPTRWQKTNVTAVVTCTDAPGVSDGDTCACAPTVATTSTTPDLWSSGIPDATVGADIMRYTRTITTSLNGATVAVRDTAGNISPDARTISIGVDTVAPTVNITTTGTAPSLAVTITATDNTGGSGIWKDNIQTQTYLATAPVPTFDDKCNVTSSDALLYESYSPTGTPLALTKSTATPITLNTSTHKLAYCIQDNAGNITKGFYPSVPVACFSSTNLPTVPGTTPSAIPSIATYVAPLIARIAPATGVGQFGYGMSTDATNANCFRGIITSNVTRLISNQYNASTASTVDWSAPAKVKSNPTLSNTNGYYYHTAMSPNLLTINTSPSGTGPKVVYAEGADIQINADINYRDSSTTTNSNTLLIIIAKRATSGANPAGGNIYINPSVKNIDAILITDGTIMNGVNGLAKDYITNPTDLINRLTINGRIYSMNTRGGSIDSSILASNNLGMITTNSGKVFANNASLTTNATPAQAAAQDLERFRVINDDGNKQCTLFLNYKTIPINTLPPILQRPSGYAGGSCGF